MPTSLSIKDIKLKLQTINSEEDPFVLQIQKDSRKGVQQLYSSWLKNIEKQKQVHNEFVTMSTYEKKIWSEGYRYIGGIDEVGRGPLAGPVVTSCVILSQDFYLPGLTDSKKLSKDKREEYFQRITEEAISIGIGIATAQEIDKYNIYQATKIAMQRAIKESAIQPDFLLLDAMELQTISIPQTSLIKGDSKSISIAASSVIAKVTRDRYMEELGLKYPEYGFKRHMGYGTAEHLIALREYGITNEHRLSFAPVKERQATS